MNKEQLLYHYFSNSLSSEQEKQLQDLLETDADFSEQFRFEKDLKRVVREREKEKLKSKLSGFEAEIAQEKPVIQLKTNRKKSGFNWSVAASIAILVGLGWLGYSTLSGADYQDLYQENFEEYPNTVFAVTRGDTAESIERAAFASYETGDYKTAIASFNKISAPDKESYLDFYIGQSQLALGELANAEKSFQKVISSNSDFIAEAHWYLALTAIKQEDRIKAIDYLNNLIANHEYNKDKARALLEELKE
ncbi:tetratricopeptide repeat protein [Aggregatimonas sangjinii]|uniref:Tetratricopeptide repeat protein n=1 Tax=Aggregatimonas sangjinii TaxID=2583587 RepID=A0A5B7SPD9_9FLAO|nr:tetratricopeptide repeat protein [Aggregatimonas sangjinii]QCW98889.1 tetratricopeptide repeat protein [Aggregatimonas sangjinii]